MWKPIRRPDIKASGFRKTATPTVQWFAEVYVASKPSFLGFSGLKVQFCSTLLALLAGYCKCNDALFSVCLNTNQWRPQLMTDLFSKLDLIFSAFPFDWKFEQYCCFVAGLPGPPWSTPTPDPLPLLPCCSETSRDRRQGCSGSTPWGEGAWLLQEVKEEELERRILWGNRQKMVLTYNYDTARPGKGKLSGFLSNRLCFY